MRVRFLSVLLWLLAATAQAQPSLVDAPVRELFDDFRGAGFAPVPAAGQLDSNAWIVTGLSAGDLAFGDSGTTGSYARGTAPAAVDEPGVWAFETTPSDWSLGAQSDSGELTPGAFETRFTNGTGAALPSFTVHYECWQFNDAPSATDVFVELTVDGTTEQLAELDCLGISGNDGSPAWVSTPLAMVYSPAAPVPPGATVGVRFVLSQRGGGAGFDQVAIDDVYFGLPGTCGNGVDEAADGCDDGDPCTVDTCSEPAGCTFEPSAMCDLDAGVPVDGGRVLLDAEIPPRYDANMPPNAPVPDPAPSPGPEADGCDCGVRGPNGSGAPAGASWPLVVALVLVRRRGRARGAC